MNLILIPQDKANHAIYGAVIFLIALVVLMNFDPRNAHELALVVTATVGALKEASDAFGNWRSSRHWNIGPHGVEFYDFLSTFLGGLLVYMACAA